MIESQISRIETELLTKYAGLAPKNSNVVEIGSYRGGSTVALLKGLSDSSKLYSIDPHECFTGIMGGTFGSEDWIYWYRAILQEEKASQIRPIGLCSYEVNPKSLSPIGLLFVDGDHSQKGFKRDFDLFSPEVTPPGFVICHDRKLESISSYLSKVLKNSYWKILEEVDDLVVLIRG